MDNNNIQNKAVVEDSLLGAVSILNQILYKVQNDKELENFERCAKAKALSEAIFEINQAYESYVDYMFFRLFDDQGNSKIN